MGIEQEKQQIYPSEKINLGMEREKQQIYPSEKINLGMVLFTTLNDAPFFTLNGGVFA